ncbi:wax ester/triacylglycerol synthase domain-containing protein [Pseudonocardia xinjiangensis]|uniref:wax ester/triacylglycerol synthase domain-containing protein n=1 Tax=Pseudonocardia xinjiangensis TaxID=75289 RepID=UPI003D8A8A0D
MNTDTPTTTATSTRTGPAPGPGPAHPRRVLLVTGGIGEGHHAAARAVEERARRAWPGVEVVWTDTLDGMGRGTGPVFRAIYAGCMRRFSWLYELYFWLLWHVRPFRAGTRAVIGAWSGRGLARQLARHSPDLVVATFPEGITGLGALRRRGRLPMPAVAVMADPAPHPLWVDPGLDLHLVSTDAAAALVRRAAPDARARVAALPVSSRFTPPPVEAARARPQVYVSCGSMAFGDVAAACAAVLDAGADVLVSSGRNATVRRRLCAVGRAHPRGAAMRVVDWVDDPAAATRDCDVVVANAGGATTLEALACARPLLLFAPIAGHGRATAALLADAGLARVCPAPADLTAALADLARDGHREALVASLLARLAGTDLTADVAALADLARLRAQPRATPGPRHPRVRSQDALFLHAATPEVPQQVGARILIEDPDGRDDWPEALAGLIRDRVPDIPLLRRRLLRPRPGRPLRWLVDDTPDPGRHVRPGIVEIGADGTAPTWDDALTAFFATVVDPVATGWELQVARDRAAGEIAVLAKVHHALGDGLAVTDALIRLLSDEITPATPDRPRSTPDEPAGVAHRLRRAAVVVRGVASLALVGGAGASPLAGRVAGTAHRRAGVCLDGAQVRAAARAHGVGTTVLLLAVVAETLHTLLTERDPQAVPAAVRTMVPMTTRTSATVGSRALGNRTAAVSIDLPTGPMSPAERVGRVEKALAAGSSAGQPDGAAAVLRVLGLLPWRLQAQLVRLAYGRRFFHALASVMPGSRRPLHSRGGLIREVYPVLPLADGVGLAVGALHWGRTTAIGITADPGLIPEIGGIPDRVRASLSAVQDRVDRVD